MKKRKITGFASFALAACLLLSSCNGGSTASKAANSAPASSASSGSAAVSKEGELIAATDPSKLPAVAAQRKDTLVIGINKLDNSFNWMYNENADVQYVLYAMNCTLSGNDEQGNIIDGTASVSVSSDGLTYTYKLKKDTFSDGTPVTANDYINCFKVLYDKSYDGPQDPSTVPVLGKEDYTNGKTKDIAGIKALDDKTLQIKLTKRNSSALYQLGSTIPISTKKYGDLIKQGDLSGFKKMDMINYVSDGPYILTSYKVGQSATLTANPNYFLGAPKIKTLIFKEVAEGSELQALTTGEVDVEPEVTCNADQIQMGKAAKFVNMWIQPTLGYGYVALNCQNPLFNDLKVRQALLYALDRKSLVKSVYGDYGSVLNCNQTKISWLYSDKGLNTYDCDPDKAASLLKEAGWTKDSSGKLMKDGKEFKFTFSCMKGNPVTDVLVPMMIDSYKKLGITMQSEYIDGPTMFKKHQKMNYDMEFMAWVLNADPNDSFIYKKGGAQNYSGFSDPEIDKAYDAGLAATTKEEMKTAYEKVYQLINKDLPCYFVYQRSDCIAYNTRVKHFKSSSYTGFWNNLQELELA
ncbi:ABC transporter substrate-binding protein [Caproicibacter fermentans]|uniref:ABC transporter substrate-binding protein n=1 Tax=Caproicibacter fermentans TaxID=2576756 RepID=A0A7G8T8W3_9FIRM|nr:ABC transporter substrate-binding protein [Caproicibacter fermentans]QNK40054.1 ABC transporter substrate-binding protein [Caproicibacter fermentans]